MAPTTSALSKTFMQFFDSEKASGIILIICTIVSLAIANSLYGHAYLELWHTYVAGLSVEHWVNDGLMAIFFLLIGLELKRELYVGELSNFKNALLPIVAAAGGVCVPAGIHFALNSGTQTQAGIGIPMATDIAFALGALALLGNRVPASLKVFLAALAVMDDLAAIVVIAVFYTAKLSFFYLTVAACMFGLLCLVNRVFRVMSLFPYLVGGAIMWYCMLQSGIHSTIAGVLLALAIPFSAKDDDSAKDEDSEKDDDEESPSYRLEHILHKPVAFIILPIFALANTGIIIAANWSHELASNNSMGIMAGLIVGKPLGITLVSFLAVAIGVCKLPAGLDWKHIFGAGLLGGIGFTMSIFITNLAFTGNANEITASKIAVLLASLIAGVLGYLWLRFLATETESQLP
ncbi:Na(+)/H(+) antiporter NhaA [Cellvibrio zantedeschiae]|uniref:Na(+)/H(+) antiporter NhaA n=1 Tax=Cellvibrio zantedeschiae TaxID=1237077 RepID=A0ABQ3AMA7_9GAMM|nr:Na+/H+ antiporter NhaA [Cellvibrio zantedeschiae]GGY61809.1 Na(+)/H(+) antiporter NhaA [Cellvibrio zantedeschiae]